MRYTLVAYNVRHLGAPLAFETVEATAIGNLLTRSMKKTKHTVPFDYDVHLLLFVVSTFE